MDVNSTAVAGGMLTELVFGCEVTIVGAVAPAGTRISIRMTIESGDDDMLRIFHFRN